MSKDKGDKVLIVKASIPRSLKLQFKIICLQQDLNMSQVIENLIRQWIQADTPTSNFIEDFSKEACEDVKGYVPRSLKLQFKVLCTQKELKIRTVIANLIKTWVQTHERTDRQESIDNLPCSSM